MEKAGLAPAIRHARADRSALQWFRPLELAWVEKLERPKRPPYPPVKIADGQGRKGGLSPGMEPAVSLSTPPPIGYSGAIPEGSHGHYSRAVSKPSEGRFIMLIRSLRQFVRIRPASAQAEPGDNAGYDRQSHGAWEDEDQGDVVTAHELPAAALSSGSGTSSSSV